MMDQDELIAVFVEESIQHLESIEPDLLTMEQDLDNIDPDRVNGIFRAVHSIKGASGFFGLHKIGTLSHVMENLLSLLREEKMSVTTEFIDALFSGIDALRTMFDDVGNSEQIDIETQIDQLTSLLNASTSNPLTFNTSPLSSLPLTHATSNPSPLNQSESEVSESNSLATDPLATSHDSTTDKIGTDKAGTDKIGTDKAGTDKAGTDKGGKEVVMHQKSVGNKNAQGCQGITLESKIVTVKEKAETGKHSRTFDIPENMLDRFLKNGQWLYTITVYVKKDLTDKGKTPLDLINAIVSTGELIESRLDIDSIHGLLDCLDNEITFVFAFATILEKEFLPLALDIPEEQIQVIDTGQSHSLSQIETSTQIESQTIIEETIEAEPKGQIVEKTETEPKEQIEAKTEKKLQTPAESKTETEPKARLERKKQIVPNISMEKELKTSHPIQTEEKIRVGVTFLNDLVNLAGEMVLGRNQLNQITMPLVKETPGLNSVIQHISRITTEMQEKIMQMRMQPVSMIFGKFQRVVRDLAKKLNKEIKLVTHGEDVELDKSIIEALSDPLTHLIRNSVDHGIESPEDREKAGKPRQGSIQLKAYHQAGHVYIDIIDDGGGIDCTLVGEKAVEKELITREQMEEMGEKELASLIFKPGFSTAKQISAVSGRGVGMDVVMTNIKQLGGTVDIESTLLEGTTISLVLPLTLAIVSGLVIRTAGQHFILPEANIDELVRIKPDEIESRIDYIQNSCVLRLREMLLPLISLGDVLGLNHNSFVIKSDNSGKDQIEKEKQIKQHRYTTKQPTKNKQIQISKQTDPMRVAKQTDPMRVLVIKHGNSQFGLQVDAVENIEEIVVKPLPRYLKNQKCFSGASIMGNGSVSLILDAAGLFEKAKLHHIDLDRYRKKNRVDTRQDGKDIQTLLLFTNNTSERFALPLELISRIERIKASSIESIKDEQYLQYQGQKLRLVFLEDYLPVSRPERSPDDTIGVIVPKQMKHPMGIVIHLVEGTINAVVDIDTRSIMAPGLFGSAILENKITLLPDMYRLFELAAPEWYLHRSVLKGKGDGNEGRDKTQKILIVEDTPFFRMIEKDYLTSSGYDVLEAENGRQALSILSEQAVDGVILDIIMPEMDGWQTIRAIRADSRLKDLPVMAVTSLAEDIDPGEGLKAGFTQWEAKLNKERLLEKLAHMLKQGAKHEKEVA
ncbi:putative CheA signal transduction histidine kinases [Desulfamplus magnetovallimortis]|uniref:Chemotaxis protein CheA n=1 Tax=Desulfamplus magnetovallimortis TaxID=1246637 RepID=A0A1W1HC58_9BACT|nr:chemotaxis protein CheW [Desulfamplus magnetovallimortis]SLM30074.1 putative CheA signal transduction histidine kinases [Desulfamplus magnetovallimortis]